MSFKDYLIKERQLAQTTVEAYVRMAKEFLSFLKTANYDVKEALYEFTIQKVEQKISSKTYNYYLSGINSFIRYLILFQTAIPLKNSHFKIRYRKYDYLPQVQTAKTIKRMHAILKMHTSFTNRDKLIISLALNHGLMPIDFQSMEYQDICFENNEIIIYKKDNNIPNFIFLMDDEVEYLTSYISSKSLLSDDSSYVFSNGKEPFSKVTLLKPLDKLSEILGEQITFRKLRNTFIVDCLGCEIDPMYIMVYMGIKNISTVLNFERLNINRYKEVAKILEQMRKKPSRENHIKIIMHYRKTIAVLANNQKKIKIK